MRKKIEKLKHLGINRPVTISGGIYSAVPGRDDKLNVFLRKADKRLYEAKRSGRNRVCFSIKLIISRLYIKILEYKLSPQPLRSGVTVCHY